MNTIPRRRQVDKFVPAELAIYKAMEEVEKIGTDVRLSMAVTTLDKAKNYVSDFIDQMPMPGLIERLIDEKNDLDSKCLKLRAFMIKDEYKSIGLFQHSLLGIQLKVMILYSECLQERLTALQSVQIKEN